MHSLEHSTFMANVGAGNHAEASDQACGQIAHDVAIKIRKQEHVKLQGIHHDLHAGVINDEFFVLDKGELRRDSADRSQKQAVRKLHNVGFVNGMNLFSAVQPCVFK